MDRVSVGSWFVPPIHCARQCKRLAWQAIWQCNDIRVTVTAREEWTVEYDLGGTIWGGSRFTHRQGSTVLQRTALPASAAAGY